MTSNTHNTPKKSLWHSQWVISHYDADGTLLAHMQGGNIFHTEGEEYLLKRSFGSMTQPSNFYIGLDDRTSLAEADTLTTVAATEPTTGAYSRETMGGFPVASITFSATGDGWEAELPSLTFTHGMSGADWSVKNTFLATSPDSSGKIICSKALAAPLTITTGQSLVLTVTVTLAEPV